MTTMMMTVNEYKLVSGVTCVHYHRSYNKYVIIVLDIQCDLRLLHVDINV